MSEELDYMVSSNVGKGFKICIAGLEFESGRVFFVKVWDSQDSTRSLEPTKCAF